jgi:peptide/nickel transport system permease protein
VRALARTLQLVGQRLFTALAQLIVISTIVFLMLYIMPGDPVLLLLGAERNPSPEAIAAMRQQLGLDQPMMTQYFTWLTGLLHLDFGKSLTNGLPVFQYIASSLPRTLELAFAAIIIAIVIGVPVGILAARHRGSPIDVGLTAMATMGISVPVYILGSLLIVVFSIKLGVLPASGYTDISRNAVEHFRKLALPAFTLGFGLASSIARMTRASMLEILSRDFVSALKAKGLGDRTIIFKHVLRNASIPIVAIIGLQLGNLMGGTVLVEALFNWPGMSTQLVSAAGSRNYPLVQGSVLVIAALFIFINMAVEIIYGILDPRIRRKRQ